MNKLKIKSLFCIVIALILAPACKKKSVIAPAKPLAADHVTQKTAIFDGDLEAFIIDEDESAFAPQQGFELIDESEGDRVVEQSRQGFMPLYFEFDAATMKNGQSGALENDLARAKKLIAQGKKIVIEGHACKYGGSPEYNMHLSEQRAKSVYNYFVKNGIPTNKITVVGRGNEMLIVPQGNKEQQAPNRRVEFIAIDMHNKL